MTSIRTAGIGLALAALCLAAFAGSPGDVRYRMHPDSQFWIEGDANVRPFECRVGEVRGGAVLRDSARALPEATSGPQPRDAKASAPAASPASAPASGPAPLDVEVRVPVRQFDCGKDPMNEDLYEALKSESHPLIRYRLQRVRLLPPSQASADSAGGSPDTETPRWRPVRTTGALTVAGSTRTVTVFARARRLGDGRARVRGKKPLRMTSFGVTPPEALFGMIEVEDRITVHFDLIGVPEGKVDE
jgi:hypothetical protein